MNSVLDDRAPTLAELDPRPGKPAFDFLRRSPKMLIDGKLVRAISGKSMAVFNPASGRMLLDVSEADKRDVRLAVRAARRAFDDASWTGISPSPRCQSAPSVSEPSCSRSQSPARSSMRRISAGLETKAVVAALKRGELLNLKLRWRCL